MIVYSSTYLQGPPGVDGQNGARGTDGEPVC